MASDLISRILSQYESGAMTDGEVRVRVLIAAGEGDAEEVFGGLPAWLRDQLTREIADVNPSDCWIGESYCGTSPPKKYEADLRRREEAMRRGIVALQQLAEKQRQ